MNRALVDTNILLDAAMPARPDHEAALLLLDEIAYAELEGIIAATSLKDVYYILSKYYGEPHARSFAKAALDAFEISVVDDVICRNAAASDEPDFEDGIVRACAESSGADFILSRDGDAFRTSRIRRLSARDYVDLFCDVKESALDALRDEPGSESAE